MTRLRIMVAPCFPPGFESAACLGGNRARFWQNLEPTGVMSWCRNSEVPVGVRNGGGVATAGVALDTSSNRRESAMPSPHPDDVPDKALPLRDDIRLLGRILGDTVRQHEGDAVFAIVERIRQTSLRYHRAEDETARSELEVTLSELSGDQAVKI